MSTFRPYAKLIPAFVAMQLRLLILESGDRLPAVQAQPDDSHFLSNHGDP
jgi:hypothetical protein